jgi:hypothetical protein
MASVERQPGHSRESHTQKKRSLAQRVDTVLVENVEAP